MAIGGSSTVQYHARATETDGAHLARRRRRVIRAYAGLLPSAPSTTAGPLIAASTCAPSSSLKPFPRASVRPRLFFRVARQFGYTPQPASYPSRDSDPVPAVPRRAGRPLATRRRSFRRTGSPRRPADTQPLHPYRREWLCGTTSGFRPLTPHARQPPTPEEGPTCATTNGADPLKPSSTPHTHPPSRKDSAMRHYEWR